MVTVGDRTEMLMVRIEPHIKELLARLAEHNERTMSSEVRWLVKTAAAAELGDRQSIEDEDVQP